MSDQQPSPDQLALQQSQAGMRFIAQTTLYNRANFARLKQYIADSYHADQLEQQSVADRLANMQAMYDDIGRVRVKQLLAVNENHVILALSAEKTDNLFYTEVKVEDDYPHKITLYMHRTLQESSTTDEPQG